VSIWVKVCGNTSLSDAQIAVDAGADAVGFVFAPSPRRVTAEQVAAITPQLPATIEKIGVFVDSSFHEIAAAIRLSLLTGVQLHSEAGSEVVQQLRAHFGPQLRILRVVHFGPDAVDHAAALAHDPNIDGILIDSRTATAVGGTGIAYDWSVASQTLFQNTGARLHRIAAGGLNPDNVAEAIATLAPWGVDVVSGVESAPGRKDPAKVRAFVANARATAQSASRQSAG
jgi:phosphoribosylanthranilate isomerase